MVIAGTIAGACLGSYALVKVTWENLGSCKKKKVPKIPGCWWLCGLWYWDACFLDLGTIFLDLYMFFGPNQIFFWPRVTKNVGDLLVCFLDPVGIFFLDLHVFVLDPGFFFDSQINCFWARFPVFWTRTCFLDLASIGGGNSTVIGAHIGLDPLHVFLTWHRVGEI